jgi:hypothetical protein
MVILKQYFEMIYQLWSFLMYKVYDKCVFANEGLWNNKGRTKEYQGQLEDIIQGNMINTHT